MPKNQNGKKKNATLTTTRDKQDAQRAAQITADAKRNAKMNGQPKSVAKEISRLSKNLEKSIHPDSALARWLASLSAPFTVSDVHCPVNYNPAPSFIQTTARTTYTNLSYLVAAGTTSQIVLYPGHGSPHSASSSAVVGADGMDAVSYHAVDISINTTALANHRVIGPMDKVDNVSQKVAIGGVLLGNLTAGTAYGNLIDPVIPVTDMVWDNPLPYISQSNPAGGTGGGAHSRWQLVSMGVRIGNLTTEMYRGGSIVSVQPNNNIALSTAAGVNQGTFEKYPTFKDWGTGAKRIEICWIPRAQDMAFWHGSEAVGAGLYSTQVKGPGMLVWMNAPTSQAQTYTVELVCNWQLSGNYLNTVGGQAPHHPELKPIVEKTVATMLNNHPSASVAPRVAASSLANNGMSVADAVTHVGNAARAVAHVGRTVAALLA